MKKTVLGTFLLLSILAVGQKKDVQLENVWKEYQFFDRSTNGLRSMNDGIHYTVLNNADKSPSIQKYSYKSGKPVEIITSSAKIKAATGEDVAFDSYQFSPDESKVLLSVGTESIYRHSSRSNYYVYDLKSKTITAIKVDGKQQLAAFSPSRNQVAFVHNNRLHIQDIDKNNDVKSFGKGKEDAFIAGAVDWVYEEEFGIDEGYFWSPEGNYLAYYQFDEREVPKFSMDVYGNMLYPAQYEFKYPKAGEANSEVSIHIINIETMEDQKIDLPESYEYIPRIKWTNEDDELVIYTMNRHQNELKLWKYEADENKIGVLMEEKAEAYIEINDNIRFLKNGEFIWTSEIDGYHHIYHYNSKGEKKKQITKGEWDVTNFYGIDENKGLLYYQSAEEDPSRRSVYKIKMNGKSKKKISTKIGWNSAKFSKGFKYYIHTHSSSTTPTFETLHANNGSVIRVLQNNEALQKRLDGFSISPKEFFTLTTEEGIDLKAWMIKPQNFDESKKYPVLMFVYGGPGSQQVTDRYDGANFFWYQTLANQGYMVVCVDNRGTGARGRDFRTQTYKQLGKYETMDQIAAAKYLAKLDYVDGDRIGIWGWSYGGYMSSLCITKGADAFKLAIAVAPVTNWRFYDSIYTERYMQTPQENAQGYDDNSPINHVDKLKGSYLLVHGSADDNVHVQNTMRMIESLVQADKQFDLFIYPDKNHGIYGGNTRFHLYRKMTDFIINNL